MADFVAVASTDEVIEGTGALIKFANYAVALFNVKGKIFAIDDICVRCGASLAAGRLAEAVISCSGCDWQYDVMTGSVNGIPALRADTFETKIIDATILVATTARKYG